MGHSHCVFAYVYGFCWDTVKKNKNSDGYRDGAMAHTEENRPDVVLFGLHLLYFPNVYAFCAGHKSVGYYYFLFFLYSLWYPSGYHERRQNRCVNPATYIPVGVLFLDYNSHFAAANFNEV